MGNSARDLRGFIQECRKLVKLSLETGRLDDKTREILQRWEEDMAAKWGQKVLVVAETPEQAIGYKLGREHENTEGLMFQVVTTEVDLYGARPPVVVGIEMIGEWPKGKSDEFIRQVNRIYDECRSFREREGQSERHKARRELEGYSEALRD